jgi:hypothetical protein
MSTRFTWQIDAELLVSSSRWSLHGQTSVEILGDDEFLGITLRTDGNVGNDDFSWVSRSASIVESMDLNQGSIRTHPSMEIHTHCDPDPMSAASKAVSRHVWTYQLNDVGDDEFGPIIESNSRVLDAYQEFVAEPITTATMAICRSRQLRGKVEDGHTYWCVSRWTLEGRLEPGKAEKALAMGFLAQDVLVIDAKHDDLHRVKTALGPGSSRQIWP